MENENKINLNQRSQGCRWRWGWREGHPLALLFPEASAPFRFLHRGLRLGGTAGGAKGTPGPPDSREHGVPKAGCGLSVGQGRRRRRRDPSCELGDIRG